MKKNQKDVFGNKKTIVPFFKPYISNSDKKVINKTLSSGLLTNGPKLEEFENKFKQFTKSKYAIGLSNATSALHLSLKALNIKNGDEVIVPDLTFAATANAVLLTGATPVIADIDEDTMNISPDSISKSLSDKTKAIIPVHFTGNPCNMKKIMKIAKTNALKVVEDCAHAIGTKFAQKHVGNFGNTGCFSFYPTKNITTVEGGMLITNNKTIADFVKLARNHGMSRSLINRYASGKPWQYDIQDAGYNYRLDEIRATLGINQLQKLVEFNKKRKNAFRYYDNGLKNIDGIITPNHKNLQDHACHLYVIRVNSKAPISRDQLFKKLLQMGVSTSVHYQPLHKFSIFKKKAIIRDSLDVSKKISNEILSLPLYTQISKSEQHYVIKSMKQILNK